METDITGVKGCADHAVGAFDHKKFELDALVLETKIVSLAVGNLGQRNAHLAVFSLERLVLGKKAQKGMGRACCRQDERCQQKSVEYFHLASKK